MNGLQRERERDPALLRGIVMAGERERNKGLREWDSFDYNYDDDEHDG